MRQVRLDPDVVELVEAQNPEGLSLSGRTNELLRALLNREPEDEPEPTLVIPVEQYREALRARAGEERRARRRRRSEPVRAGVTCLACGAQIRGAECMACGARAR